MKYGIGSLFFGVFWVMSLLSSCSSSEEKFIDVCFKPADSSVYVNGKRIEHRQEEGRIKTAIDPTRPLSLIVLRRGYKTKEEEVQPESTFWRWFWWGNYHPRGFVIAKTHYEIELEPFASKEEKKQNPTLKEALARAAETKREWKKKNKRDKETRAQILALADLVPSPSRHSPYVRQGSISFSHYDGFAGTSRRMSALSKNYIPKSTVPPETKRQKMSMRSLLKKNR